MTVRWGILATGRIAGTFADAIAASDTAVLAAVGSRTQDAAERFVQDRAGVTPHGSYEALLADAEVDAVYVATPHPQHAQWTIKALEAGKAVLCEKPMGVNHAQVMAMVEAAREQNAFLMEAFMYRTHPMTERVVAAVREGAIGEVRHIDASFGFAAPFSADSRLYRNDLAGGGIMDVGCYAVSMCRLIAREEPQDVRAVASLADTGVDAWSAAVLRFPSGIDVLNRECDAGRVRAFGASNWSLERVRAANAYARANGLRPFVAVSNQFSLARMVDPVWPGCVSASTPDWRAWLAAEGVALFPWSSQARGFFTSRFDAVRARESSGVDPRYGNQPSDDEMRRCWFAEDNFARRERAVETAAGRGVAPIVVALAWVLSQPFPCFPLIGPRVLAETAESLTALGLALTPDELHQLHGE